MRVQTEQYELQSIQVGKPRHMIATEAPQTWTSGIHKVPVRGPVFLGKINLDGDGQADLENHGGPDRAVLLYSANHYPFWRSQLSIPDLANGWFGENFTVDGLTEETVSIGDTFQLGEAVIQISQPRNPCWKLARRVGVPDLVEQVNQTGKSGWYARVLVEGMVEAGMKLVRTDRPCPELTISYAQRVWKNRKLDGTQAHALAECPYLSAGWKRVLANV